jgi:hypothetical protein
MSHSKKRDRVGNRPVRQNLLVRNIANRPVPARPTGYQQNQPVMHRVGAVCLTAQTTTGSYRACFPGDCHFVRWRPSTAPATPPPRTGDAYSDTYIIGPPYVCGVGATCAFRNHYFRGLHDPMPLYFRRYKFSSVPRRFAENSRWSGPATREAAGDGGSQC